MKLNRNRQGFAVHLLAVSLLLVTGLGISGWHVYQRNLVNQTDNQISETDYLPRALMVTFNDGVTAQQAVDLMASYDLTVEHPEAVSADFTPKSYRAIKDDQFTTIQNKLRKYPEVISFFDDSGDPTNRAGKGEKWVEVIWRQDAKYDQIKTILVASGLGAPTQPQGITRTLYVDAPAGQENDYVKKLNQSSIVKNAARESKPVLIQGCEIEC